MKTISWEDADIFINLESIPEATIIQYFRTLNNSEFMTTAQLFAEQGRLNPPFDKTVQGRNEIAQYLEKEAKGMRFCPESGEMLSSNSIETQDQIQGKVQIKLFTVNVTWLIQLNSAKEITMVEVKLLASLNDLLKFNHS